MLNPPISQRDIDEGTIFLTRSGGKRLIVSPCRPSPVRPSWKWKDERSILYTDEGFYCHTRTECAHDLVSRAPKPSVADCPITDADIGHWFLTRDGNRALVTRKSLRSTWPWVVRRDPCEYTVTSRGIQSHDSYTEGCFDLITRITPEESMGQVILEDHRVAKPVDPNWVMFSSLPVGALFELYPPLPKEDGDIYRKAGNCHREQVSGRRVPCLIETPQETCCRRRPELRLRMTLEDA